MKPYYGPHAGITIFHGDCREILPTLGPVDLVLTDPPYGISYKSGANSSSSISTTGKRFTESVHGDNLPFDPSPWLNLNCGVMFTGAQHFYDRLPAGGALHVWDKRGEYKRLDQGDCDIIWSSKNGASRTFYCVWRGICRHSEHSDPILHPTQKPLVLMEWLLEMGGHPRTVLDPFMGSGTTLLAAKRQRLTAIGIEIEERYCEIAAKRLSQEVFDFAPEPPAAAEQVDLFAEVQP